MRISGGQFLGAVGDTRSLGLPASREHGEDAPGCMGVARALALAQLGVGVPDGGIQPLQQEIKDTGETVGLHLDHMLESNLASVEVVNHGECGHTPLLSL